VREVVIDGVLRNEVFCLLLMSPCATWQQVWRSIGYNMTRSRDKCTMRGLNSRSREANETQKRNANHRAGY
jgi:hypothetical protein